MLRREDMMELTRRMTPSRSSIDRIAGCYYDQDGYADGSFKRGKKHIRQDTDNACPNDDFSSCFFFAGDLVLINGGRQFHRMTSGMIHNMCLLTTMINRIRVIVKNGICAGTGPLSGQIRERTEQFVTVHDDRAKKRHGTIPEDSDDGFLSRRSGQS